MVRASGAWACPPYNPEPPEVVAYKNAHPGLLYTAEPGEYLMDDGTVFEYKHQANAYSGMHGDMNYRYRSFFV